MDKTQAQARLAELDRASRKIQDETAALREILDAPEPTRLLPRPKGAGSEVYWVLIGDPSADGTGFRPDPRSVFTPGGRYDRGNVFTDLQVAQAYADALETFLMLRGQPGTEPARVAKTQYVIEPMCDSHTGRCFGVEVVNANNFRTKLARLSPCFGSEAYAKQAVNTLGTSDLIQMFTTFSHAED